MRCPNCHGQRYFESYFPCPECNATGSISCCGDQQAMEADEFDCIDCNVHVFSWFGSRERCATCQWIHERPELTQREIDEIRVMTHTPILDKYRDDAYQERACDACGKLYRGPAVYCSLECAMKDA